MTHPRTPSPRSLAAGRSALSRRRLLTSVLAGAAAGVLPLAAHGAPGLRLTYFGHACFLLETPAGVRVLMDPLPTGIGYDPPLGLRVDVVTISHEHADHNQLGWLGNKPRVLRGLTGDKRGWIRVDEKQKDLALRSVGLYHDDDNGRSRGLDTAFVFEAAGVRVAHLGDLGHVLTDQQLAAIGAIDVALIPVGGHTTLDGEGAQRVLDQLRPRLAAIPMHYKTESATSKELDPVDAFLAGRTHVRREPHSSLMLSELKQRPWAELIVLGYK